MIKQDGFSILLVLSILGLLSSILMTSWFASGFRMDIIEMHVQWKKNFYKAQSIFDIGIQVGIHNFDMLKQQLDIQKCVILPIISLLDEKTCTILFDSQGQYNHSIRFQKTLVPQDGLVIQVIAIFNVLNNKPIVLYGLLKKMVRQQKVLYDVSHFTIGSSCDIGILV